MEQLAVQMQAGVELTGAAVAERLGCSERTGRRLLRQAADSRTATDAAAAAEQRETG